MAYEMTYTPVRELAELWKMLFPQIEPLPDSQWALWLFLHKQETIREGIVQLAAKYRKLNGQMQPLYMLKFASSVMNRITRNTKERIMNNGNPATTTTNINLDRPSNAHEAALAAREHLESEIAKGEALLERLPEKPTYADLREIIWQDHERLMKSAGLSVSHVKGDHEAC